MADSSTKTHPAPGTTIFRAARRAPLLHRSAVVLATAALSLTALAGPARAVSGPAAPDGHSVPSGALHGSAENPEPAPAMPAPLVADALPEAQAIAAKYQADAQAVQTKASTVNAALGPLQTRAADAQTTEANLAAQYANLQTRASTLNAQADALNNAINAHNAAPHQFRLPAEASQLAAYDKEKADLEAQQSSLQSQFSTLTAQTNQLQNAQNQADATVAQVNADIQKHNSAVAALRTDIANLQAERQTDLAQIAGLLQNFLAGTQTGGASPLATAGGDQSAPPAALAQSPQARALPSGGGDQAAPPPAATYALPPVGATGTPGTQTGQGTTQTAAPPPVITQAPVTTYLAPSAIAGLPADQAANVNPAQTYSALIPEPSGNYAVLQPPPPAGTTAPPGQQAFSDAINRGARATTYIAGKPVVVDHVVLASPAPAVNQGADTARPAQAAPPAALPAWLPRLNQPGAVSGPPVSINALQRLLRQQGVGAEANMFDIEYAPVVLDGNGNPTYAIAPVNAQGNPEVGADGKPIIRLSNLGLQNPAVALNSFDDASMHQYPLPDNAPCPQHSFSGGTKVLMADGSTKAIADVKVGDVVENARPGGPDEAHRVDQIHVTTTDTDFTDVVVAATADTGTVTGTANHPYYDATVGGFVDAGALHVGDRLQSGVGGQATVGDVRPHLGPIVTYDLTIDGLHTYYVVAGHTPVLVHNCGLGPGDLFDLDKMSKSGEIPKKQSSVAGRSLQEHADRPITGSNWPRPSGKENPAGWIKAGQTMLDEILTNPGSVAHLGYGRIGGVWQDTIDVRLPDGRGARFDYNGDFSGFLD